jgi:hypothetical protein
MILARSFRVRWRLSVDAAVDVLSSRAEQQQTRFLLHATVSLRATELKNLANED